MTEWLSMSRAELIAEIEKLSIQLAYVRAEQAFIAINNNHVKGLAGQGDYNAAYMAYKEAKEALDASQKGQAEERSTRMPNVQVLEGERVRGT